MSHITAKVQSWFKTHTHTRMRENTHTIMHIYTHTRTYTANPRPLSPCSGHWATVQTPTCFVNKINTSTCQYTYIHIYLYQHKHLPIPAHAPHQHRHLPIPVQTHTHTSTDNYQYPYRHIPTPAQTVTPTHTSTDTYQYQHRHLPTFVNQAASAWTLSWSVPSVSDRTRSLLVAEKQAHTDWTKGTCVSVPVPISWAKTWVEQHSVFFARGPCSWQQNRLSSSYPAVKNTAPEYGFDYRVIDCFKFKSS